MPEIRLLVRVDGGLYAAHSGRGRLFLLNVEVLQITGVAGVRAAADLLGELAHSVYLNALAVLALEQADSALRLGLFDGHLLAGYRHGGFYSLVDQPLDLFKLVLGQLARAGEVEAQALGGYVGALLGDVRAYDLAQRGV